MTPRTEAGKTLQGQLAYDRNPEWYLPGDIDTRYDADIDAIEAEAMGIAYAESVEATAGLVERTIANERARIRAAVEGLPTWDKRSVPGGFHVSRRAVLAIIEPER